MGRIKTKLIKKLAFKMVAKHGDVVKDEFGENKKVVESFMSSPSKRLRNTIAGYVTRLVRSHKLE